ncbi:MAG: hypothetical protein AB1505_05675 [Candidatus Latescibacterota bacterium]
MSTYSPRVTTDRLPDYWDLARFAAFPAWRDLPPAEKAVALWRYVTDRQTGLYPVQGIYEDPDPGPEYAFFDERDLCKVLNVHGHGYCGLLSPTLAGIFAQGALDHTGVRLTDRGLEAEDGGWVTFAVRTPYIIVGQVVEMGPPGLVTGAATVSFRSLGALCLSVSTDEGCTWKRVAGLRQAGEGEVDLTPHVLGRYGYRVRFEFQGAGGLLAISIDTWTQLAPPSLPRLFAGANALHFATGDRYGYRTSVKEVRLNLRHPAQLERHLVALAGQYEPLRTQARMRGEAVLRVDALPGRPVQWLTAGGYFHAHLGPAAGQNRNAILCSATGPEGPWMPVCQPRVPEWADHWHYGMDGDVVLPRPAETVYLKYVGDPGLNQVWIYAHCLEGAPQSPVRVTHGYEVAGQSREDAFVFTEAADYEIHCPAEPANHFLRFAVDSEAAGCGAGHAPGGNAP